MRKDSEYPVGDICMTEDHQVYIAGEGYKKVKDLKPKDVIINEVGGKTERIKVLKV